MSEPVTPSLAEPVDDAPGRPVDLFDDPQWTRPPLVGRSTVALAVLSLVVAGFAGGIWVQKRHSSASATTTALPAGLSGLPAGFNPAGGGLPAGFNPPGAAASAGPAAGAGTGAGSAGAASAQPVPVVVGTVATVTGSTLSVKNFAGTVVTVRVPATAKVTVAGLTLPSAGDTVSVAGTKAADGSVDATSILVTGHG